jgi:O-antigen/teichoic acid export membrane protein
MTLWRRTIVSASWSFSAKILSTGLLLLRSILLARWLPVELFGIYGFAVAAVTITLPIVNFGMDSAFLHRSSETSDEKQAAAIYFTLRLMIASVWAVGMSGFALWFASGERQLALIVLTLAQFVTLLTYPGKMILTRRVIHRRLSLIIVVDAVLATAVALTLAWYGIGLWALLSVEIIGAAVSLIMLYLWRPVWKPHFAWSPTAARYFFGFGSRTLGASTLSTAIDKIDDLWTSFYLGDTALGFYNRAFAFARYPRLLLADPVTNVVAGSYAELKGNRPELSRFFFHINALLLRASFLVAGILALVSSELIELVLGEKWLPMVTLFRLMLVYTMFDPIRKTVGSVFIAVGKPELLSKIRAVQFVLLAILLYALGLTLGVTGVAIAVNIVLFLGIVVALQLVQAYVDFSYRQMFFYPLIAIGVGIAATLLLDHYLLQLAIVDLLRIVFKSTLFGMVYVIILLLFEREQFVQYATLLRQTLQTAKGQ